jgi:hypothetical protein
MRDKFLQVSGSERALQTRISIRFESMWLTRSITISPALRPSPQAMLSAASSRAFPARRLTPRFLTQPPRQPRGQPCAKERTRYRGRALRSGAMRRER